MDQFDKATFLNETGYLTKDEVNKLYDMTNDESIYSTITAMNKDFS